MTQHRNLFNYFLLAVISLTSFFIGRQGFLDPESIQYVGDHDQKENAATPRTIPQYNNKSANELLQILKRIARGLHYVRSSKARNHFLKAYAMLSVLVGRELADTLQQNDSTDVLNPQPLSPEVCPERWMGMTYGYPYYFNGFVIDTCSTRANFGDLVTVLLSAVNGSWQTPSTRVADLRQIVRGIRKTYPNLHVMIAVRKGDTQFLDHEMLEEKLSVTTFDNNENIAEGDVWIKLLRQVGTKYAFIGRSLTHFLPDARLERLARMLSYTDADIVGGAFRNETGHLRVGCFETAMRNYAFRLVEGYDISYNSCVLCDYLGGPFIGRPRQLLEHLNADLSGNALFVDLFQRLRSAKAQATFWSCPDALFFTRDIHPSIAQRADFLGFAKEWRLNEIQLPVPRRRAEKLDYSCAELDIRCTRVSRETMPKCCIDELSFAMRRIFRVCRERGILCELEGGSMLGALKFNSIIQWERDGDLNWLSLDYEKLLNATEELAKDELKLQEENEKEQPVDSVKRSSVPAFCKHPDTTSKSVNCEYFAVRTKNWRVQLYGVAYAAHSYFEQIGYPNMTQTLLQIDGDWVPAYPNPALSCRNLYGDNIFQHVEHWDALKYKTGWEPYKTGKRFLPCDHGNARPNSHACLDQYLPDGNLQFLDLWI